MALLNFEIGSVDASQSYGDIPAGDYPMMVAESEQKYTKDGTGQYLNLKCQIIDGQYKNRTLFLMLNLWNKSDDARKRAFGDLQSLCLSMGMNGVVVDSAQLHSKPFLGSVKYDATRDEGYRNSIRGFKPYAGASGQFTAAVATPAGVAPPPVTAATSVPATADAPWD